MNKPNRGSTNSPNEQPSRPTRPDSPKKPSPSRKKCPPGFKWVNGRCEFVYDKNKYK